MAVATIGRRTLRGLGLDVSDLAPQMLKQGYSSADINELATYGVSAAQLQALWQAFPPNTPGWTNAVNVLVQQLMNHTAPAVPTFASTAAVAPAPPGQAIVAAAPTLPAPVPVTAASNVVAAPSTTSTTSLIPSSVSDYLTEAETWAQQPSVISSSIPNYWLIGGGILALLLLSGGSSKKRR
jgi:hypothetical protein